MLSRSCARTTVALALSTIFHASESPPRASAVQITINYKTSSSTPPAGDTNGTNLARIANEAARRWGELIEDDFQMTINIWYVPQSSFSSGNTLADAGIVTPNSSNNRTVVGDIRFSNAANWYFDATETQDEEFNFTQTLFRDLNGSQQSQAYDSTTAQQELEAGFQGTALPTATPQAQTGMDLLSVALHEIGHHMGVTNQLSAARNEWSGDNDYDLPSSLMRGAIIAARTNDGFGHLIGSAPLLMQPSTSSGIRTLPSATDVFAAAKVSNWSAIDLIRKDFIAADTGNSWITSNWMGNQVPGLADDAFIRSSTFDPTVELVAPAYAGSLFVGQGDDLSTNAFALGIADSLTIDGTGTQVFADMGGRIHAGEIVVQNGAQLLAIDGGVVDVGRLVISQGSFLSGGGGGGTVGASGSLVNDGTIYATGGTLLVGGVGTWDLDGSGAGALSAVAGSLAFDFASPPTDALNGTIVVGQGKWLSSSQPFHLGSGADLSMNGGSTAGQEANLNVNLTVESSTASIDVNGMARFHAPFSLVSGSVDLASGAVLELAGAAVVSGGNFNVATGNARLRFQSTTQLSGGSFSTSGTGAVELNGTTEYLGGTLNVVGRVHQEGDATVSAPTTINGSGVWDLDGNGNDTAWYLSKNLTLNVAGTDTDAGNQFDGQIYLNGSGTTLAVNTSAAWTMHGLLAFDNGTAVGGSAQMNVTGTVRSVLGLGRIDAPVAFKPGASVSVGTGDVLYLVGTTNYEGGAYSGGTIRQGRTANVTASTTLGTNLFLTGPVVGAPLTPLWLDEYDWDGSFGPLAVTNISPGAAFTINAVTIDDTNDDGYDGTVNINGGTLIVNTGTRTTFYGPPNSAFPPIFAPTSWRLDGTMNLQQVGGNAAVVTAQYGSPMQIYGAVNALNGNATITGMPVTLAPTGHINVSNGATLNMGLVAQGTIDVQPGGLLRLNTASTLQSSVQMIVDGTAELTSGTTFQGGAYQGGGLLRQLGSANFAQTTLLDVDTEFTAGGTTTIAAGQEMRLAKNGQIAAGAVFQGTGALHNLVTSKLVVSNDANVGVPLVNDGTMVLGASPGSVVVQAFTQSASGTLQIEIGGKAAGQFDYLTVNSLAQLRGTLEVSFIALTPGGSAFTPSPGDSFDILNWGTQSGSFSSLQLPALGGFLFWNTNQLYTSGVLSIGGSVGVPGDYNNNGINDAGDYIIWRNNVGTTNALPNDSIGGVIGQAQYSQWRAHFGQTAGSGVGASANVAVPEPATLVLLMLVASGWYLRRGRVAQ